MEMELKSRKDIPAELTWDLSLIYATEEAMYQDADSPGYHGIHREIIDGIERLTK